MNAFENVTIDQKAFAYRDLLGQDLWDSFAVSASVTVIGTPTYVGRYRMVGRKCEYQVSLISSTSIATTAGTSYINLPIAAAGIAGMAVMTNNTTDIAVGLCHIDVATSRCYLPSQVASGDAFTVAGWYEI